MQKILLQAHDNDPRRSDREVAQVGRLILFYDPTSSRVFTDTTLPKETSLRCNDGK